MWFFFKYRIVMLPNLLFKCQNLLYYMTIIVCGCVYGKKDKEWSPTIASSKEYGAYYPKYDMDFCMKTCTFQNGTKVLHVACKCNNVGIEHLDCVSYKKKYTVELRVQIISKFNYVRNTAGLGQDLKGIFEPASDLRAINYDIALEYVARCTANRCALEHDPCRFTLNHKYVQQLIYVMRSEKKISMENIVERAVKSWLFTFKEDMPLKQSEGNVVGTWKAWSIVLWNKATHVGCSTKFLNLRKPYNIFLVCNIAGQNNPALTDVVYRIGKPCKNCHRSNPCNAELKALCGKIRDVPIADLPRFRNQAANLQIAKFTIFFILIYFF